MVFHLEAGWGGLPTRVQKTKIYNLETGKYSSTPQLKKKPLAGAILWVKSAREGFGGIFSKTIWRELFQKHLAGTFKNNIWREQFQKHIWQENFGRNILAGNLIFFVIRIL